MESCPKEAILQRLKKIEGQVKGIQHMVEEGKGCGDILMQVTAVRSAINRVGALVFENYTRTTLQAMVDKQNEDDTLEELVKLMDKFTAWGSGSGGK